MKTCQTRLFHFWVIWKLTYFIFETFCSRNRNFLEIFPQKMRTKWIRLIWEDDGKRKKFAFKIAKKKKIPKMKISKIKNRSNQNLVSAKFKKRFFEKNRFSRNLFLLQKTLKEKNNFQQSLNLGKWFCLTPCPSKIFWYNDLKDDWLNFWDWITKIGWAEDQSVVDAAAAL